MRFLLSLLLVLMVLIIPGTQLVSAAQLSGNLYDDLENTGVYTSFGMLNGTQVGGACTPFGDGDDEDGSKEIGGGVLFYRK